MEYVQHTRLACSIWPQIDSTCRPQHVILIVFLIPCCVVTHGVTKENDDLCPIRVYPNWYYKKSLV